MNIKNSLLTDNGLDLVQLKKELNYRQIKINDDLTVINRTNESITLTDSMNSAYKVCQNVIKVGRIVNGRFRHRITVPRRNI